MNMKKRIKIVQVTNNLGIGGLERVVVNLCKNFYRHKFDVSVCCLSFKGDFADELEKCGVPVFLLSDKDNTQPEYFAFWKLKNILKSIDPDIVHTHNTNALIDGLIASILCNVPVRVHTDHARLFPDKMKYMIIEGLLSLFLDRIVAVSYETKDNLIKYEKINKNKINVINNGIDGSKYKIIIDRERKKIELGISKFKYVVGLGVRLTKQKGIEYLIKAAPKVLEKHPDTVFLIVGYGVLLDQLKLQAKDTGVEGNFLFTGPRLDMPEILQVIDVYVLPSEWEGLPLVLLEAMAAGKAIVATDVGGNSVAVDNGRSGFIVRPKDPDSLAEKINELLQDKDKREKFAQNAIKKFDSEFSVQHMTACYEKLYYEMLLSKGYKI